MYKINIKIKNQCLEMDGKLWQLENQPIELSTEKTAPQKSKLQCYGGCVNNNID